MQRAALQPGVPGDLRLLRLPALAAATVATVAFAAAALAAAALALAATAGSFAAAMQRHGTSALPGAAAHEL